MSPVDALDVPLVAHLGCHLVDPDDLAAGVSLVVGEEAGNGVGGLHASAVSVLGELAAYLVVATTLEESQHVVTVASSVQLLAAAPLGSEVRAHAVVERRTRRLAFVAVRVVRGEETVALLQVTKAVTGAPSASR